MLILAYGSVQPGQYRDFSNYAANSTKSYNNIVWDKTVTYMVQYKR